MNSAQLSTHKDYKNQVRYYVKEGQFQNAIDLALSFKDKTESNPESSLKLKSQALKLLIYAYIKSEDFSKATQLIVEELEPMLKQAEQEPQILARLYNIRQRMDDKILHKDYLRNIQPLEKLFELHKDDKIIIKYYIETLAYQVSKDILNDQKYLFKTFKKADQLNQEILVKQFKYNKLSVKILLRKIYNYQQFFTTEGFQKLTSQAMREVGLKSTKTPLLLAFLADYNSIRGDQDKSLAQIQRAEKLASEVLDGKQVHLKISKVLIIKSNILIKLKKYDEALQCIERALDMVQKIFGHTESETYGSFLLRKASALSEKKGEEQKAENTLKIYIQWTDKFQKTFANQDESLYRVCAKFEAMQCYQKLFQPDKIKKLHAEIKTELAAMGQEISFPSVICDFLGLQVIQDFQEASEKMDQILQLSEEVDQLCGYQPSIVTLMIKCHQASYLVTEGNSEQAEKIIKELLPKIEEYYEGNEVNEMLIDPLMILTSTQIQSQNLQEAVNNIQKAERITKELNGEQSEKLLEIYHLQFELNIIQQNYQGAITVLIKKTDLAQIIYGEESEQYSQALEDQINFYFQCRLYPQIEPLIIKLLGIQKKLYGEYNQKVLLTYNTLYELLNVTEEYSEAFRVIQKQLAIYKQLNGQDVIDTTICIYMIRLGQMQFQIKKYDDSLSTLKLSEQMLKKLPAKDPNVQALLKELNEIRTRVIKQKMEYDKLFRKPLMTRLYPNTPMKKVMYFALFAGMTGTIAFMLMKKRS